MSNAPNASLILALKLFVLASWFAAAAAFLFPDTTLYGRLGRMLFAMLSVVHLIECAVFYKTLRKTGRPLGLELLNTFLFGIIHFTEVKAIVETRAIVETKAIVDASEDPS